MTWLVHQHWDPLKICVVGRSYPPEFYSWISNSRARKLFEKIAIETEEDYQALISLLTKFDVEILRPNLARQTLIDGKYLPPPMTPRDWMNIIGDQFFKNNANWFRNFYLSCKDSSWPHCDSIQDLHQLPSTIVQKLFDNHNLQLLLDGHEKNNYGSLVYRNIFDFATANGHAIIETDKSYGTSAMVARCGKDLYFGTPESSDFPLDLAHYRNDLEKRFTGYNIHILDTKGHSDGTFCPVSEGLVISIKGFDQISQVFTKQEIVQVPRSPWPRHQQFKKFIRKVKGRWWIPGWEQDQHVVNVVDNWLNNWVGYVTETVFSVNMLIINPTNIIVSTYNKEVFSALERHGITPHLVPFRHRNFWDCGTHCITADLHRQTT